MYVAHLTRLYIPKVGLQVRFAEKTTTTKTVFEFNTTKIETLLGLFLWDFEVLISLSDVHVQVGLSN